MKSVGGNGQAYKHYCLQAVVDKTNEGPILAECGLPIPSRNFSSRLPEDRVDLCKNHLLSKLKAGKKRRHQAK